MGGTATTHSFKNYLGWEPSLSLRAGLEKTYSWIYRQYQFRERGDPGTVRELDVAHV